MDLLVCPETKQALAEADADLVARINVLIDQKRITTRGGQVLVQPLTAGLVRHDEQFLYPVVDGIAKMIADDAIDLAQVT
jgi:uncharacterized protein YbaR (Trm112 family)